MVAALEHLFRSPTSLLLVVRNTTLVYLCLVAGLRLLGRRTLGQLTVVDLVVLIVMGSAVETAMVGGAPDGQPNTSLPAGLTSAATLFVVNRLYTMSILHIPHIRRLLLGEPVLLVNHGELIEEHLKRHGLTEEDVLEAIRERGAANLSDVRFAVMELDGSIHVVTYDPSSKKKDS